MATKLVNRAPTRTPLVEPRRGPSGNEELLPTRELTDWMNSVTDVINGGGGGGGLAGGSAFYIDINGTLAIASDLGSITLLIVQQTALSINLSVKQAPMGANLIVEIYMDAALWWTGTILDGTTSIDATAAEISALGPMPAGANVRIDVTQCGTTFPGSWLSARIGV